MLKIVKASAGSGKTYTLAKEYIRLLLLDDAPDRYRHVLAVTFTNKATDEMKRRILKELHTLASDPDESPYLEDLLKNVSADKAIIQERALRQLRGILHDYSAFAVSTIDKFFQQALRAFSREIGQFSSYQVQLDRQELVTESVDRLLDDLSEEDTALLGWLTSSAQDQLSRDGRLNIEAGLKEMASSLASLPEGKAELPREKLSALRTLCREVRTRFTDKVQETSKKCLQVLSDAGVALEDSNGGFLKQLYGFVQFDKDVDPPTAAFKKKADAPQSWFSKGKAKLLEKVEGLLEAPLKDFTELWELPYKEYVTAGTILGQIYGLGVASELREAFIKIQKEKNVISLEDSSSILRGIIDGTPTPFIYEKLGVRYEDFLLDEFQDTSQVQWDNFRPLLHGSLDSGNDSLVVGDVKQSIYRWRGSDWNLLGNRLEHEFREPKLEKLDTNRRTCRQIVVFNNSFFNFAAMRLDQLMNTPGKIASLYADVEQEPKFGCAAPGSVEVVFSEDQIAEILDTIDDILSRGGKWQDIAILVRNNADGAAIALALVQKGIPVVSDDTLYVKSSVTVRRLVSELSLIDSPPEEGKASADAYMAGGLGLELISGYHSLTDLSEGILRELKAADPSTFNAEIPYIQAFMDYLQDWVEVGGNSLGAFLKAWKDVSLRISSPQIGDSVRVITIHKSKGLEFPFVIFPNAEKVTLFKKTERWCEPSVKGTALEEAEGIYHVELNSASANSLFSRDLSLEQEMQATDAINLFYVALTRAKYGLKIISAKLPKSISYSNFSHILADFVGEGGCSLGSPFDFGSLQREDRGAGIVDLPYDSYPSDEGGRLAFSSEAADYFGEDGLFGVSASRRIRGSVLHSILSKVEAPDDLPAAVESAVRSGLLPAEMKEETLGLLSERIDSVRSRGWFGAGASVRSEASVMAPDGNEYRPDRVVISPDGTVQIVDYKFGEVQDKYNRQVSRYMALYRSLGYEKVEGYLWYLEDNFIIFVN